VKDKIEKRHDLLTRARVRFRMTFVIVIIFCFTSCEKNISVEVPHAESEIVVEGYIETGEHPSVILSNSLPFFGTISTNILDLLQYTIKGATVTINNGSVTDTLKDFLNIGYYLAPNMIGEAGKTYLLKISTGEKILSASTFIPPSIHLDSVWFKVDGNRDSLGYAWAHLTDPDTLGNYYRWFAKRINHYTYGGLTGRIKDTAFIAPRGSVFEDKFINGRSFDFAYNRGSFPNSEKEDDNNDEEGFFKKGDTVVVKFCTIDRAHFEFWRTEETQAGNNGNPFGSPAPVTSNIIGGLGIWGGYNATYDTIIAE
jgi:hypothetical protein